MRTRLPLRAQIVPQRGGKTLTRHVLLVYRDGGITDIGQLPGRKVLVSTLDRGQIASTWLDVLLMRQGLGPAVEEAVDLDIRDRPGYAVPPVLFGQADACIVETRTFDLLCELNPQLRRELRVLSASPPLLTRPMCTRQDMDPVLRKTLLDAPCVGTDGEQILALLQTEQPALYREENLAAVIELFAEYQAVAWLVCDFDDSDGLAFALG